MADTHAGQTRTHPNPYPDTLHAAPGRSKPHTVEGTTTPESAARDPSITNEPASHVIPQHGTHPENPDQVDVCALCTAIFFVTDVAPHFDPDYPVCAECRDPPPHPAEATTNAGGPSNGRGGGLSTQEPPATTTRRTHNVPTGAPGCPNILEPDAIVEPRHHERNEDITTPTANEQARCEPAVSWEINQPRRRQHPSPPVQHRPHLTPASDVRATAPEGSDGSPTGSPVSPERLRRPALSEDATHTAADTPAETCVHCSFPVDSCMCIRCPWCHSVLFGAQCLCAGSQLDQSCSQATDDGAADLPTGGPSSLAPLHAPTNDAPLSSTSTGMSTAHQHIAPSDGTSPHPLGGRMWGTLESPPV